MQPIDRDVLTGLQHGDERALEQVFRARFEPLTQQASAALGDDTGAPKVVEGAFVRVWGEREHIDTPEALEAFLFDAVKTGAARERSRRAAAHRMGGAGPSNGHNGHATTHAAAASVTPDDAWAHVTRALHNTGHSAQVQDQLHDQLRHASATHVASLAKRPAWQMPTAIAVVLGIAIFGFIRWMDKASADTAVTSSINSVDARSVSTLAAQVGNTTLPDKSPVTIAADTKLRIPPNFGDAMRAVKVDGAASLSPVANEGRPLTIRVGDDASITANGAVVDVRQYAGEPAAALRVRSGSATIKSLQSGASQTLNAGQTVLLAGGAISAATPAQAADAFAWSDKKFSVSGKALRDVLPQLVRFYGLEIKVKDEGLLSRPVTFQSSLESSREVIAAVEKAANAQFGWEDKTMVLTPKP